MWLAKKIFKRISVIEQEKICGSLILDQMHFMELAILHWMCGFLKIVCDLFFVYFLWLYLSIRFEKPVFPVKLPVLIALHNYNKTKLIFLLGAMLFFCCTIVHESYRYCTVSNRVSTTGFILLCQMLSTIRC